MRDKAVLVETTILVDYLRGSDAAAEYLDNARAEGDLLCSTVTQAELIVGSRTRGEIREIDQLLARFQNEPIAGRRLHPGAQLAAEVLPFTGSGISRLPAWRRGSAPENPYRHLERETLQSATGRQGRPAIPSAGRAGVSRPLCRLGRPGKRMCASAGVLILRTFQCRAGMTGPIGGKGRAFPPITHCITEKASWRLWFRRICISCGSRVTNGRVNRQRL
jgi:hypothetical protein